MHLSNTYTLRDLLPLGCRELKGDNYILIPIVVVFFMPLSDVSVVSCSVGVIVTVVVVVSVLGRIVTIDRIEVIGKVFMVVRLVADVVMLVVGGIV